MEFTNSLLNSYSDITLRKYVNELNNISDKPINNTLLNDFIDISLSKYINHYILIKLGIITKKTNIIRFLKLYDDHIVSDGFEYYITNDNFKIILSYESQTLYEQYTIVLRYIRWYKKYQQRLGELFDLRNRYYKLDNILSEVRDQITKITSISTTLLNNELNNLYTMEKEIYKMKIDIQNTVNKLTYTQ